MRKNVPASVKQRLLNLSRRTGEDFQLLLTRYAVERLLFRLSASEHREGFVLKGAMLFALWTGEFHRPTRDLDLLGFGDPGADRLKRVFAELCRAAVADDGLGFDEGAVSVEPIREDQEYGGQRVGLVATLGQARIDLQIDVGFGDAITPGAEDVEFPTLLGMEAPRLRAYPKETVVAEKLEALVKLGLANSRMKDFYDLVVMARTFAFRGELLCEAISRTFARRGTGLPGETPVALTEAFARDEGKQKQWAAFRKRSGLADAGELEEVVKALKAFLQPVLRSAERGEPYRHSWAPGGGWVGPAD
ncbi:nucleotidyl transferase AbiEii/AbiGii toxin family protein [Tautonia sociabilis]|uniref:Nucleotidyl transferase AbiEii/AbiGii toxin family protein n=1 Tax=Tautonia sociabilis TaxID=2080755 RepID=A0A432MCD6_9BACT|nr:nucleotidyl transferase AbiEii/AbiGii toxin family protein [Tautonia sociabilis]RUL81699.1 nucleotidyl transferase AbiEii/AbiGii toxin family protein [Tautonia sociabilis]